MSLIIYNDLDKGISICKAEAMKNISKKTKWYQNKQFLSGAGISSLVLIVLGGVLYVGGILQFQKAASEEAYASSFTLGKQTSESVYTLPPPDPNHWDQVAPTLSFVSPKDGAGVSPELKVGSKYLVPVEISASDNDRISRLYIFVDGVLDGIQAYNETTYKVTARVPTKAGLHVIKAVAYDYNNNPTEAKISVVVPSNR